MSLQDWNRGVDILLSPWLCETVAHDPELHAGPYSRAFTF